MEQEPWEARAAAKRAAILDKIDPQWRLSSAEVKNASKQRDLTGPFVQQFLTAEEVAMLSMESVHIVDAIKQRKLTSVKVTTTFCKAAAIAHQIGNCIHEIFFKQALDRAKQLDEYYQRHGKTMGPLHGLPVSLKDQIHVKGNDTTTGYVGWIGGNMGINDLGRTHQVESRITTELLSLGAVLYCKTSTPQTLFFVETRNNIIGQTLNPHNQNLSCGGSSGGEGALLALRGSTVGVGTDIGGSVRIPAAFNGVFGIKPTPGRLSSRDIAETNPGQTAYRATVGFLSTSLDGLELMLKSILSTQPWVRDPAVIPMPFRQDVVDSYLRRASSDGTATLGQDPLKLGVLWTDGVVNPHPPVSRGVHMVAEAMKMAGHKVVNWEPPSHETAKNIHLSIITADGAADIHKQLDLSKEPMIPELESRGLGLRRPMGLLDFQHATLQGIEFEARYSDYWNSTGNDDGQIVDAFVMPVAPHAAVIPGKFYHIAYTESINLLNYSVAVIPVTKADKRIDTFDKDYKPPSRPDERNWRAYDPEIYDVAPVGVQVVARKFEEEKVLAIAKVIYEALKKVQTSSQAHEGGWNGMCLAESDIGKKLLSRLHPK